MNLYVKRNSAEVAEREIVLIIKHWIKNFIFYSTQMKIMKRVLILK